MGDGSEKGIILKGIGGFYYVKTADAVLECKAKGIFRKRRLSPLPGDSVEVERADTNLISEIHERRNFFLRPNVANVDRVYIVVSATDPTPNQLVIDRLTALCAAKGAAVSIVLTKTDLAAADALASVYRQAGFELFECTLGNANGLQELKNRLSGGISVFMGNSGVGKSTLLNALVPGLSQKTGETSKALGRGRHTTREVELFDFGGGYVVDTPGFSSMDVDAGEQIPTAELQRCFTDFYPWRERCRFADCAHIKESGCAVRAAVASGEITAPRYESYCQLYTAAREREKNQY